MDLTRISNLEPSYIYKDYEGTHPVKDFLKKKLKKYEKLKTDLKLGEML